MNTSARHSVSVSAVITDAAGDVLMIQRRDNGQWEPPGGVLEVDEAIESGVKREVLEETGLSVEPIRLTGVYKNMAKGVVALVFRATVTNGQLMTGPETARIDWIGVDTIERICDEAYAVRVTDALDEASVAIRAHDGVRLIQT